MKRMLFLIGLVAVSASPFGLTQDPKNNQDPTQRGPKPDSWSEVVSAETLEDEVKTISSALPKELTTSRSFAGRGYRKCREQFSELAVLFGVISQYEEPVRWQSQAAPIAMIFGRNARNCKVGSQAAFDAAKRSSDDLTAIVAGGKADVPAFDGAIDDWGSVSERPPLMARMERALMKSLLNHLESQEDFVANKNAIVREAEMIALISTVIRQKGFEDADDDDYREHARELTSVAKKLVHSARRDDQAGAKAAAENVKVACTRCHESYR